jgi:uncharacterized protein (DUF1684 family)
LSLVRTVPDAGYVADVDDARRRRAERLRGEQSWFNVVGLHWLPPGTSMVGHDPANDVVLPGGPPVLGAIDLRHGIATLRAASPEAMVDGEPAGRRTLRTDVEPDTTFVSVGDLRLHVIERQSRLGLRVVDLQSPARQAFTGLEYFPVDPAWRVEAAVSPPISRFQTFPTVLGGDASEEVAGVVAFELVGRAFEILAVSDDGSEGLFLIFGDQTNGSSTYEAGRYLYTPPVVGGRVTVDFNLALNPPCAFTRAATCSLPPPDNRLPIAITAGERRYLGVLAG